MRFPRSFYLLLGASAAFSLVMFLAGSVVLSHEFNAPEKAQATVVVYNPSTRHGKTSATPASADPEIVGRVYFKTCTGTGSGTTPDDVLIPDGETVRIQADGITLKNTGATNVMFGPSTEVRSTLGLPIGTATGGVGTAVSTDWAMGYCKAISASPVTVTIETGYTQ